MVHAMGKLHRLDITETIALSELVRLARMGFIFAIERDGKEVVRLIPEFPTSEEERRRLPPG